MIATTEMQVTDAERALLLIIRRLGSGYIEGIGVAKGQPTTLKNVTSRVDLSVPAQLKETLEGFSDSCLLPGSIEFESSDSDPAEEAKSDAAKQISID